MQYATKQQFGGQRASVSRNVAVVHRGQILAGIVVGISACDEPEIRVLGVDSSDDATLAFEFQACATETELESLPDGSWTWPPRV